MSMSASSNPVVRGECLTWRSVARGVLLGCLFGASSWGEGRAAPRPEVAQLLQQVSADGLEATVRRMVAFETRFVGSDSNRAATQWLREKMAGLGYTDVRLDSFKVNVNQTPFGKPFVFDDLTQWNVVATKPGVLRPSRQIIIGGHFDSISLDRRQEDQDVAPGADDNASGVAAVLEIARLLRAVDLDATLVFACFGAEELGLIGSRHYARAAQSRDDDIRLMLQLDAIGSRSATFPEAFTIDTASRYLSEGEAVAEAARDYTSIRARRRTGEGPMPFARGCRCSDHQPFIDNDFPGIGLFQHIQNPAPHLNMSTDTLDQVDLSFVEAVASVALAAAVEVAGFPARTPDFDGNGHVGFTDFVAFAGRFDTLVQNDEEAGFDLDRNGFVGFSDFVLFALNFDRRF